MTFSYAPVSKAPAKNYLKSPLSPVKNSLQASHVPLHVKRKNQYKQNLQINVCHVEIVDTGETK